MNHEFHDEAWDWALRVCKVMKRDWALRPHKKRRRKLTGGGRRFKPGHPRNKHE